MKPKLHFSRTFSFTLLAPKIFFLTTKHNTMKKILTAAAFLLLLIVHRPATAQDNTPTSASQKTVMSKTTVELQTIAQEFADAGLRGDKSVYERYLADTYIGTTMSGHTGDKATWIKYPRAEPAGFHPRITLEDVQVAEYGTTAVLNGKEKYNAAGPDGRPLTFLSRFIQVYQKQGGQWKLVAGQSTAIPADKTVAKVAPAVYDAYVGQYEIGPDVFLTFRREGDKLLGKVTGQEKEFEFLPESETTFFIKGQHDVVTFVKDDKGQVTHIDHRENDGQLLKEKKVK